MTLAQFVPFLPEIFLAIAGFAVLLLFWCGWLGGRSMGRRSFSATCW